MAVARGHPWLGSVGTLTARARSFQLFQARVQKLLCHHSHGLVQEDGPCPWGQGDKIERLSTGLPSSSRRSPAESLGSFIVSPAVMWNVTEDTVSV